MRIKDLTLFVAVPLVMAAFLALPAKAAPQILGLVASGEPIPMTCTDGMCSAELSSVCLQEHRSTPSTGQAYLPSKGTVITLMVTGADGIAREQRVETELRFASIRQYTAVKVSLPEATVRQLGNGSASLSVAPMASIIPVAVSGDPNPLSADEIASYTGSLRATADDVFASDADRVNAMRILNRMINTLPEDSRDGIEKMAALRGQTMHRDAPAATQRYLNRAERYCRESLRVGMLTTLRQCLGYQHDYLSGETTNEVWNAMKPGS